MTKMKETLLEFDDLVSSMCYDDAEEEEDHVQDLSDLRLLPPSSSWSILVDVRELATKSSRAVARCHHPVKLLCFKENQISFLCQFCHMQNIDIDEPNTVADTNDADVEMINDTDDDTEERCTVSQPGRDEVKKKAPPGNVSVADHAQVDDVVKVLEKHKANVEPSEKVDSTNIIQEKKQLRTVEVTEEPKNLIGENEYDDQQRVDSDEEVDQLLIDSPEDRGSRRLVIDEASDSRDTLLNTPPPPEDSSPFPRDTPPPPGDTPSSPGDTPLPPGESDQESSSESAAVGLRLRPMSELQPLAPGLPQFTSNSLEEGVNPMDHVPEYSEDDSLVEEVGPRTMMMNMPPTNSQTVTGNKFMFKIPPAAQPLYVPPQLRAPDHQYFRPGPVQHHNYNSHMMMQTRPQIYNPFCRALARQIKQVW